MNTGISFLRPVSRSHSDMTRMMRIHYSRPRGFVGRNICYLIVHMGFVFGAIAGGSCTLHLPGRDDFFGDAAKEQIVNNIFFHVERVQGVYPCRNFIGEVLTEYRKTIWLDWCRKYDDPPVGHETLVELPRTGECYTRDGWREVGITKGFTCKREAGDSTDGYTGRRVWNTSALRPKRVFVRGLS